MKRKQAFAWFWPVLCAATISNAAQAGTWRDHFSDPILALEWTGNRDAFQVIESQLNGVSASPVTPSPFSFVEIAKDTTDCTVGVWMKVVEPNMRVCTKGAIVVRHTGINGYVFALHEATQTAEIYRLSNHEMLLNKAWNIELKKWYYVRLELHGPAMTFFVNDLEVGTVVDSESPSGAVGLAVQDAESVRFDDFMITGPNVDGNVDNVEKPDVSSIERTAAGVVLRFTTVPPYDYFVQVSSSPGPSHDWETLATYRAKLIGEEITFIDPNTSTTTPRFYRIEKVPCNCR